MSTLEVDDAPDPAGPPEEPPPEPSQEEEEPRPERRPLDLLALSVAFLLPIAFFPDVYSAYWTPKAMLLLFAAGLALPTLARLVARRDPAAIAAVAFLAAGGLAAMLADRRAIAFFGLYNIGNGWLFYAAVMAMWALGRSASERGRSELPVAIAGGLVVSAVIAVVQTVADLSAYQLGRPLGRADALLGNPVHLGTVTAAGFALAGVQWTNRRGWPWLAVGFLCSVGLQLSGSRFGLGVAVLALAVLLVVRNDARALAVAAVFAVGLAGGEVVSRAGEAPSGATRVANVESSGFTARTEMWKASLTAIGERPLLGAGPAGFREATSPHRSLEMATAEGPDRVFADAHNVVVEVAVTTGLLGLAAVAAFAFLALRRARGPLAWFGVSLMGMVLVQPLNVGTVPLAALALGAAAPAVADVVADGERRSRLRALAGVSWAASGVAGVALGGMLFAGDLARLDAFLDFRLADAERSEALLPPWSETAEMVGRVHLFRSIVATPDDRDELLEAVEWRREAAARDPGNPNTWVELGELQFQVPDHAAARRSFLRAVDATPQSARARLGLGEIALLAGDRDEALRWYTEALVRTTDANNRGFIERRIERAKALPPS
jgi:O-antigen ligase